jgi:hypothetical protein
MLRGPPRVAATATLPFATGCSGHDPWANSGCCVSCSAVIGVAAVMAGGNGAGFVRRQGSAELRYLMVLQKTEVAEQSVMQGLGRRWKRALSQHEDKRAARGR